jgi:hypothetical protein
MLNWCYVAKVIRKLNREKAFAVDSQKIGERLAITKESGLTPRSRPART